MTMVLLLQRTVSMLCICCPVSINRHSSASDNLFLISRSLGATRNYHPISAALNCQQLVFFLQPLLARGCWWFEQQQVLVD